MPPDRFPSPFDIADAGGRRGLGVDVRLVPPASAPSAASWTSSASGSPTACTTPTCCTPTTRSSASAGGRRSARSTRASSRCPRPTASTSASSTGGSTSRPVPAPTRDDIAARAEEFGKRAGHYYERWDAIYERVEGQGDRAAGRDQGAALRPAARPRARVDGLRARRDSAGFRMIRDFNHLVDVDVRDLPVPLRAAQHRLRRLPDVLRDLQERVPRHLRPVDLADGRRPRRRAVPARRRAEAAGQGGAAARRRPTAIDAAGDAELFARAARDATRRRVGGRLGAHGRPVVRRQHRPRPPRRLPRAPDLGRDAGRPAGRGARVHAQAATRARRSTGRPRRCCASATGSRASTAS